MQVVLEHDVGDDGKDGQRDTFLYHLQLHQVEGTSVLDEAQTVGGHLAAVFEESNAPGEQNNPQQGPVIGDTRLLKFQVAIPGQRHEYVAQQQQQNGV